MGDPRWFVYLVVCQGGAFYCGMTTDVTRRVHEHNAGLPVSRCHYTHPRRPVVLAWSREVDSRAAAAKLEAQVKRLGRAQKIVLTTTNQLPWEQTTSLTRRQRECAEFAIAIANADLEAMTPYDLRQPHGRRLATGIEVLRRLLEGSR